MDTRQIGLCVFFILCAGIYKMDAATLTASVDPNTAIKGDSSSHRVSCRFELDGGDSLLLLTLFSTSSSSPSDDRRLATLASGVSEPRWASDLGPTNELRQRSYLAGSLDDGLLSLVLNNTLCQDNGQSYRCDMSYTDTAGDVQNPSDATSVQVEAPPLAPSEMGRTPNSENVTEYSQMTFTCEGNVGRPAGNFQWFIFNSSQPVNVTSESAQDPETQDTDGCTFRRRSTLTLNMTRTSNNQRLVVRCRVNQQHGNSDDSACSDPDTDFCRMSPQIDIQYPVSVSVMSDAVAAAEGSDKVITCNVVGNPAPHRIEWHREGENETLSTEPVLRLNDVTLNHTGNYICTAYNSVTGSERTDSVTVFLSVEETTTPPPTTTTSPTTTSATTEGSGGTGTQKAGAGDDTTIIIVVVVVVLVVIIIIVVVVVILKRRRRKEVEEPPEKPFNSHAGINTLAVQPDLVNNGQSNPNPYKGDDGLTYAELQFDNKPRSRRPMAFDDSQTDYSSVSMPSV